MVQNNGETTQGSSTWAPTVAECYGRGWGQMWKYFLELLLIGIVGAIIGSLAGLSTVWVFFGFVYGILIVGPVDYGVSFAHLKAARGDKVDIQDMFEAFKNYLNAVLASLLVGVIVGIGLVLLIVPGIVFACKLALTPYLVVDRKMEVIEAVKESWKMTDGHALTIFGMGLLAIPISIAGLICLGVGVIVSIMWIRAAFASLYHSVSSPIVSSQGV